jgi:hypothetical protein
MRLRNFLLLCRQNFFEFYKSDAFGGSARGKKHQLMFV